MEKLTMAELRAELEDNLSGVWAFEYALAQDEVAETIGSLGPAARRHLFVLQTAVASGEDCAVAVRKVAETITRMVPSPTCRSSSYIYTAALEWLMGEGA